MNRVLYENGDTSFVVSVDLDDYADRPSYNALLGIHEFEIFTRALNLYTTLSTENLKRFRDQLDEYIKEYEASIKV